MRSAGGAWERLDAGEHAREPLLMLFQRRAPRGLRLVHGLNHRPCPLCDRFVSCARHKVVERRAIGGGNVHGAFERADARLLVLRPGCDIQQFQRVLDALGGACRDSRIGPVSRHGAQHLEIRDPSHGIEPDRFER